MHLKVSVFVILAMMAVACQKKTPGRFISETDTNFNKDIRDASAKINKDPFNAELYYKRGNAFYYQKLFKDAVLDFGTAAELDSLNAMYHFRLGETILNLDSAQPNRVLNHLGKAVQLKPEFHEAKLALAKVYMARQDYEKAQTLLTELEKEPEYADRGWFYRGLIQKEKKDTTSALVSFEKALQVNPQMYDAVMQMAGIKAARKDELCLKYYDRALAINEFSDEALYGKGLYNQQQKQYAAALVLYTNALKINPAHRLALYNCAVIHMQFENWVECQDFCDKILDLAPKDAKALALRGYAFEKTGNKKAALDDYRAALEIDPSNEPAKAGIKILEN